MLTKGSPTPVPSESPGPLLRHKVLSPKPRGSDSAGLRRGPRLQIPGTSPDGRLLCVLSEEEQGRDLVSQTPGRFGAQQVHRGRRRGKKAGGAAGPSPACGDQTQRPQLLFGNKLPPPRSPGRARLTPGECQPSLLPAAPCQPCVLRPSPFLRTPDSCVRKQGRFQVGAGAPGLEKLASRKAVSSPVKTADTPSPQPLTATKPGKQAAPLPGPERRQQKTEEGQAGLSVATAPNALRGRPSPFSAPSPASSCTVRADFPS